MSQATTASRELVRTSRHQNLPKRRYFVGERALPDRYLHISDANMKRMFLPNPDPSIPQHGYALVKYLRWMENKAILSAAADDEARKALEEAEKDFEEDMERSQSQSPHGRERSNSSSRSPTLSPERPSQKRKAQEEDEDFDMLCHSEDINILQAFVKNRLAFRMYWKDNIMLDTLMKDCLGIDWGHPQYDKIRNNEARNRDTWQGRILNHAHGFAARFAISDKGKALIKEKYVGKKMTRWVKTPDGEKEVILELVPSSEFPVHYSTLATAKAVFATCMRSIDQSCLVKPNGTPSFFGDVLIKKAVSLIQVELTYIIECWIDDETGEYSKDEGSDHCRNIGTHIKYLATIDRLTCYRRSLPTDTGESITVGVPFPMPDLCFFEVRGRSKKTKVLSAGNNAIYLGAVPEDEDAEGGGDSPDPNDIVRNVPKGQA
ncbi:hypothetical protein BJ508DRAFT_326257 [Ascobolus immersus RN42]|uniref:Uncharacterized protein n=1 Tax=Ascobolus immersus RN42 TaxID=1160509 RepID=A0A3N4I7V7_ASCIM|nr:hypothetical protein BJ508DRAFT_326257 [Ascobolus immersus RN42]